MQISQQGKITKLAHHIHNALKHRLITYTNTWPCVCKCVIWTDTLFLRIYHYSWSTFIWAGIFGEVVPITLQINGRPSVPSVRTLLDLDVKQQLRLRQSRHHDSDADYQPRISARTFSKICQQGRNTSDSLAQHSNGRKDFASSL